MKQYIEPGMLMEDAEDIWTFLYIAPRDVTGYHFWLIALQSTDYFNHVRYDSDSTRY